MDPGCLVAFLISVQKLQSHVCFWEQQSVITNCRGTESIYTSFNLHKRLNMLLQLWNIRYSSGCGYFSKPMDTDSDTALVFKRRLPPDGSSSSTPLKWCVLCQHELELHHLSHGITFTLLCHVWYITLSCEQTWKKQNTFNSLCLWITWVMTHKIMHAFYGFILQLSTWKQKLHTTSSSFTAINWSWSRGLYAAISVVLQTNLISIECMSYTTSQIESIAYYSDDRQSLTSLSIDSAPPLPHPEWFFQCLSLFYTV